MALFRSSVSKQRALVVRTCSVAVYYVHSHLQYTSACSNSHDQIKQRLKLLPSYQCKNNELSILKNNQPSTQFTNLLEDGRKDVFIDNAISPKTALLGGSSPIDPLTTPTHLALMSLSYDDKWCKHLETAYNRAMKSRELLGYTQTTGAIKGITYPLEGLNNAHPERIRVKENDAHQDMLASNIVMFSNHNKDIAKQKEKETKVDDKCDPLLLATVYQALLDELPAFFQKGHGYKHYHQNVKFVNGLTNATFSGLRTYKCVMTSMRLAAQMCMSDIRMDILKITKDSKECNVKVRWRVKGIPRYALIIGNPKDENRIRYIDGFSIFDVDVQGLIHCHRLLKLMPSQSPQTDNPLWALNTAAVIALLRQQRSFEMLARHRVEDIEQTCLPF